jgi:antitoxin component YwqK of YwqJK toxin-antitoxin module
VALSDDEGKSWKIKKLATATPHAGWTGTVPKGGKPQHGFGTLGYCDAVQTPDGLIHLMTSKGKPSMHFAMNEAWILSPEKGETGQTTSTQDGTLNHDRETWPNGNTRVEWSWSRATNGMPVLQGTETWFYENGSKQYTVTRDNGVKLGLEEYYRPDGSRQWSRDYKKNGSMVWTSFWPNGAKKSESHWQGALAQGLTTDWSEDGKTLEKVSFKNGRDTSANPASISDD